MWNWVWVKDKVSFQEYLRVWQSDVELSLSKDKVKRYKKSPKWGSKLEPFENYGFPGDLEDLEISVHAALYAIVKDSDRNAANENTLVFKRLATNLIQTIYKTTHNKRD